MQWQDLHALSKAEGARQQLVEAVQAIAAYVALEAAGVPGGTVCFLFSLSLPR